MAAEKSHLLSVDEIKHKYEKTVKDIFAIYQQQKQQEKRQEMEMLTLRCNLYREYNLQGIVCSMSEASHMG